MSAARRTFKAALAVCLAAAAARAEWLEVAPSIRAHVECARIGGWRVASSVEGLGPLRELVVSASSPTSAVPPIVTVEFRVPQVDVSCLWKSSGVVDFPVDWKPPVVRASISLGQPLYALLDSKGGNRLTVASREALRETHFTASYDESTCEVKCRFSCFVDKVAPETNVSVRVRFDSRRIAYGESVGDAAAWMSADARFRPAHVPSSAHDAVYSSWYVFHKNLFADVLERECAIAAGLGMKTLIVDDGWQDDADGVGDYANVGGFAVSKRRFPDMKAHVARIHALGMKYLLWYPISLVGFNSPDYARFSGKYLAQYRHLAAATLDPRFPDVREYLVSGLEKAMRDYGLDGFKIDFLDMFPFGDGDPKTPGRDIAGVPQAVDRLMTDLMARLREVNPEVLVEFRQEYVGPAIRKYGNIIRVADCPGSFRANRLGIAQLRLTSGETAVHSDMLRWHTSDSAESASCFVLNSIFGTVQYSVRLETLPARHREMVAHWLGFAAAHWEALRGGSFRAEHPESGCPVVVGESADERVIGLYEHTSVARVGCGKTVYLLNATGEDEVYVDCPDSPESVVAFDTFGRAAKAPSVGKGVSRVAVPRGGYLRLAMPSPWRTRCDKTVFGDEWVRREPVAMERGRMYRLHGRIRSQGHECANETDLDGPFMSVAYLSGDGRRVGAANTCCVTDTAGGWADVFALAELPADAAGAEVRMVVPGRVRGVFDFETVSFAPYSLPPPREPKPSPCGAIDRHGRLLVEGRPFLPLGMYFETWDLLSASNLDVFAQSPFNTIVPYSFPDRRAMDLCAERGLRVLYNANVYYGTRWALGQVGSEADEDAWVEGKARDFRGHPALLGWYVNDEFALNMLERLDRRYELLRRLDPDHPVWGVFMKPEFACYLGANLDVLGVDPYPIAAQGNKTHVDFSRCVSDPRDAIAAYGGKRPLWSVIQAFDWKMYYPPAENTRAPTEEDLRAMTWLEIASGANGLFYYAFTSLSYEGNGNRFDQQWDELRRVADEVKAKESLILSDPGPSCGALPEGVAVRTWRQGPRTVALAANSAHTNASFRIECAGFRPLDVRLGPLEHEFRVLTEEPGAVER